jgi:group I intron endonuclease
MIVYKVTNLVNGKIYIGRTISTLEKRKHDHLMEASHSYREGFNAPIHKAIREFGEDNFKWEIIDRVIFQEYLILCEAKHIEKLNSKIPHGYNVRGGDTIKLFPYSFGRQNLDEDTWMKHYKLWEAVHK